MKRIFVSFLLIVLILATTPQVGLAKDAFEEKDFDHVASQNLIASTSKAKFEAIQWKKKLTLIMACWI